MTSINEGSHPIQAWFAHDGLQHTIQQLIDIPAEHHTGREVLALAQLHTYEISEQLGIDLLTARPKYFIDKDHQLQPNPDPANTTYRMVGRLLCNSQTSLDHTLGLSEQWLKIACSEVIPRRPGEQEGATNIGRSLEVRYYWLRSMGILSRGWLGKKLFDLRTPWTGHEDLTARAYDYR